MQLGSVTSQNMEGLVRVQTNNASTTRMGVALRFTASNTFYHARLSSASNNLVIGKVVTGTNTDLFTTAFTVSTATFYWIRFRVVGTNLYARVWADGGAEPGSWTLTGTDSSITGAGGFGLTINSSSTASTWDFDSYTVTDATTTMVFPLRAKIATQATKVFKLRSVIRTQNTTIFKLRTVLTTNTLTKIFKLRSVIKTQTTKIFKLRAPIRTQNTKVFQLRLVAKDPPLASGGFTLFASGTPGTVSFDHFRVTEYPDPSLSLAPILPRLGSTGVSWNALVPTNTTLGMDISYDGVNWTDVSSGNGGSLPTLYSQPDPSIDGFSTNTSANYTNTNQTGGATGTWTYDTTNSRLAATGGTNAIYTYNALSRADVDFFADLDQSDAGGLVWRFVDQSNFYYLLIGDSLASSGTKNTVTLYKVASNVQTQLATAAITYTLDPLNNLTTVNFTRGTYRRFRVTMLVGVITVSVDGVQLLSYTDGSPLSAGKMGLYNNGGTTGSRYYQLWLQPIGDYVSGTPAGDTVTGTFVYTRQRLATTDPTGTPQVEDVTTDAFTPDIKQGVLIPSVTYNSSFINQNFDGLAKQSNYSWFIDANKTFHFRGLSIVAAPWIVQSAPAGLVTTVDLEVDSNLELDVANDLYRNRQTILGAVDTVTASALFIGDGNSTSFTLGYPLATMPVIYLNGVLQTVGLKGTTGSNWYYAINDPVIEQDASGTVLQATDTLSLPTYSGFFVVNVVVDDTVQQTARAAIEGGTGIVENVEDHTGELLSLNAATTLANQLLARYAISGRTLIFTTSRTGLDVGQTLSIFFPEEGINDGQFFITEIETTLQKGISDTQVWWYKVTCSELPKQASWAKIIASGLGLQ